MAMTALGPFCALHDSFLCHCPPEERAPGKTEAPPASAADPRDEDAAAEEEVAGV